MSNTLNLGAGIWGTKEDSLLAYNSENGNYKPLPFDFTRASSATVVNKAGLIETVQSGIPRIDFSDNTNGALLLEPQRTNLIFPSDIGNPRNPSGISNYLAPDGTFSAYYPQPIGTSRRFREDINAGAYASGTQLTYSWYRERVSTPDNATFIGDLDVKIPVNATFSATTQISSNISGYERFMVVFTITDGSLASTLRLYYGNVIGVGNSSVAYWGHQLEQSSYPTSYIPTQGSTVTRVGEVCSGAGNDQVINSTEGVLYAEISALDNPTSQEIALSVSEGQSGANRLLIRMKTNGAIGIVLRVANTTEASIDSGVLNQLANHKVAVKWKVNDIALWIDGVEVGTDNLANVFPVNTLDEFSFNQGNNSNQFYGNTKDVRVYNTALTDSELATLTTI